MQKEFVIAGAVMTGGHSWLHIGSARSRAASGPEPFKPFHLYISGQTAQSTAPNGNPSRADSQKDFHMISSNFSNLNGNASNSASERQSRLGAASEATRFLHNFEPRQIPGP
jgi:hypothetical protein